MPGNNNAIGKHSSGYFKKRLYDDYVYHNFTRKHREIPDDVRKMKYTKFHIGVSLTNSKIYIEDAFAK